jgi:23S rRNA pseudouridine2605 synthase
MASSDPVGHTATMTRTRPRTHAERLGVARHGVARVISKLGLGSRTQAAQWVRDGRVRVNQQLVRDADFPVRQGVDHIEIEGRDSSVAPRIVLILNKPRGLVTSTRDERGRDTVYACFAGSDLPWVAPVGRLDKASEGLLLFSNDPVWAARITSPESGPARTYHVQIDRLPSPELLRQLQLGVAVGDETLGARSVRCLRSGTRNAWLEVVLDEGRNRHIRRLLAAFDIAVLRLVRVAIGPLVLGKLAKGQWRMLTPQETDAL